MADLRKLHAAFVCGNAVINVMNTSVKKWLWGFPIGAIGAGVAVLAALNPSIEAQTSPENPDARLRTRRYQASLQEVRASTLEIIPGLRKYVSHWRLADSQKENQIHAEVPVFLFTDDLEVTLKEDGDATVLDVHSKTRFPGKSDLGENRRHILQLLAALDEKFAPVEN